MSNEKAEFSKRLLAALKAKGWGVRPVELEKRFNSSYSGPSVSFQTVSAWLGGRSIPRQERLRALADLVDMEPQTLLYGTKGSLGIREHPLDWPGAISDSDRAAILALLGLPPATRKLARELILALREVPQLKSR